MGVLSKILIVGFFIFILVAVVAVSYEISIYLRNKVINDKYSCSDSDNGKNIYVKGHIWYSIPDPDSPVHVTMLYDDYDVCADVNSVKEYYCDKVGGEMKHISDVVMCPAGYSCSNGACVLNNMDGAISSGSGSSGSYDNSDMPPPPPPE